MFCFSFFFVGEGGGKSEKVRNKNCKLKINKQKPHQILKRKSILVLGIIIIRSAQSMKRNIV